MIYPAIVISSFNRPKSLERLLHSISLGNYPNTDIKLIISIDYEDSELNRTCCRIAKNFKWDFGSKEVIVHKENLGLKKHILSCGDLTRIYDTVIVLEDDLYVSPNFYTYSLEANDFYYYDKKIAGISLYCHKKNILNNFPFEPIDDNCDVYFLKLASSWGQLWNKIQWGNFRKWYGESKNRLIDQSVPKYIRNWPETSWLKHYTNYLVINDMYYVYPKSSLTTNFSDAGTNNTLCNNDFQVPLNYKITNWKFENYEELINVYDTFFEILPEKLSKLNPELSSYNYEVDLNGLKPLSIVKSNLILSSKGLKRGRTSIKSFGLNLKPLTLNIVLKNKGVFFKLDEINNFDNINDNQLILERYYFHKQKIEYYLKLILRIFISKFNLHQ